MDINTHRIPAPSSNIFNSYKEAYDTLKQHGTQNGYGFHLRNSHPYSSESKTWYYFYCDKAGKYQSQATIQQTVTQLTRYPFSIAISKILDMSESQ
jgi:hypothetical protein